MKVNIFNSLSADIRRGLKNSLYLTIANILTVLITLIGFIYIPNRLGSHDFGLYSLALSFVAIFHIFGFGGLAKVIIREAIMDKKSLERVISNLFNFKLLIAIAQIFAIVIVALLIPTYDKEVFIIIVISSHIVLFRGLKIIPSSIIQAEEQIKTLAKINVTHSLMRVLGIVLILFFINNLIVVMCYIAFINFIFIYVYYRAMNRIMDYRLSINLKEVAIPMKFFKQGLIFTLMAVGGVLSTKIDLFMLSVMSSMSDVAVYGLSEKIVSQFEMLRGVVLTAFYPIVIKHFKTKKMELKTLYILSGGIFFGATLFATIYAIFAGDIISVLYSDEYSGAIEISIILFFYLVFFFANLPFSTALQSVGLERYILYIYPFSTLLNILLNYFLFSYVGVVGLAYSTLIVQAFMLLSIMIIGSHQLKKGEFVK